MVLGLFIFTLLNSFILKKCIMYKSLLWTNKKFGIAVVLSFVCIFIRTVFDLLLIREDQLMYLFNTFAPSLLWKEKNKRKERITQNNIFNREIFINLPPKTCFSRKATKKSDHDKTKVITMHWELLISMGVIDARNVCRAFVAPLPTMWLEISLSGTNKIVFYTDSVYFSRWILRWEKS